jgi:hypothetical protein
MGRFREAEGLLQSSLDRYKEMGGRGGLYIRTAGQLVKLYTEKGNHAQAEALVKEAIHIADHGLFSTTNQLELENRKRHTFSLHAAAADLYEAMGRWEEAVERTMLLIKKHPHDKARMPFECSDLYRRCAEDLVLQEDYEGAMKIMEATYQVERYGAMIDAGIIMGQLENTKIVLRSMRVLARVLVGLGRIKEAELLRSDVNETEAIMQGLQESALEELRGEMKRKREEEQAGHVEGNGAATEGASGTRKKANRKQKKRKAAAAAKRRAEQEAQGQHQQQQQEQGEENGEGQKEGELVEQGVASLTLEGKGKKEEEEEEQAQQQQQQQQQREQAKQQMPQAGEEEEEVLEECSVCLNDIEGEEAGMAVLLVCTHLFHAECLSLWEKKTEEKGLAFTCPMCRAAIVVATERT